MDPLVHDAGVYFWRPDAERGPPLRHAEAPVRFAQIEDDAWGTPAAVGHMASHFTANSERSIWRVSLAEAKAKRIGHLGFFRSAFRATLWPPAAAWLEGSARD